MATPTIACVLRSGRDFGPEWVEALYAGVRQHAPDSWDAWRFVCLSDRSDVPGFVPLEHDWPRWWPKLELFRPDLFDGPVLYLDLDTLVVGDLTPFLGYRGDFAMLSDFGRPKDAQSGVMAWAPGPTSGAIWRAFTADPRRAMRYRGDGEFIRAQVHGADRLQDLYPNQIVSFKRHCRKAPPGGDVRIVAGHGRPRFSDPRAGWAHKAWKAQLEPVGAS